MARQMVLFFKAIRRDAEGTDDLFSQPLVTMPVQVGAYTRKDGSQVKAHTELRKVRAEKPAARAKAQPVPEESGAFGPILRQFRHDAQGAIAYLKQAKTGEAVAALHHPEVGDIDLVWGEAGTAAKDFEDGYGLAKIAVKHPEVLDDLQGVLDTLREEKEKSTDAYKILSSPDHKAIVRADWDRNAKTWLLTAYSIEEVASGAGTRAGAAKPSEAARASTGSAQSLAHAPTSGKPAAQISQEQLAIRASMKPFKAVYPGFGEMTVTARNSPILPDGHKLVDVEYVRIKEKIPRSLAS